MICMLKHLGVSILISTTYFELYVESRWWSSRSSLYHSFALSICLNIFITECCKQSHTETQRIKYKTQSDSGESESGAPKPLQLAPTLLLGVVLEEPLWNPGSWRNTAWNSCYRQPMWAGWGCGWWIPRTNNKPGSGARGGGTVGTAAI